MTEDLDLIAASNGLNASTGDYFYEPQTVEQFAQLAMREYDQMTGQPAGLKPEKDHLDKRHVDELRSWHRRQTEAHFGWVPETDPKQLSSVGWGVIFPAGDDPKISAIRDALTELLDHRRTQVMSGVNPKPHYYREFIGKDGYYPNMTKGDFLGKYNAGTGLADPENMPYYLLIVGDPETIPYSFHYQLDVQYAVGRIYFDTLAEYAQYARSVVTAETGKGALPRRVSFFGVKNDDDPATHLSSSLLIAPLEREVTALQGRLSPETPPWQVQIFLKEGTSKARLNELLGGSETPALLFTASHGAAFNNGDLRQLPHQGALVCQDWPGPKQWGRSRPVPQDFYLAGDDIGEDARLLGLIAFHFACFGAGTPHKDDFSYTTPRPIAPHSFIARLPQRLLGHPKGGALAVIGHVDRAWDYSFKLGKNGRQTQTFRSTLYQLMNGFPIGAAFEPINSRYAELSSEVTEYEKKVKQDDMILDKYELVSIWMANNDARSYVIIGDPAVKALTVDEPVPLAERQTIAPIMITTQLTAPASTLEAASTAPTPPVAAGEGANAGNSDSFKHERQNMQDQLPGFAAMMKQTLSTLLSDVTRCEVSTYVGDDMEVVTFEAGRFQKAQLHVKTIIKSDGSISVCVPHPGGGLDADLWQVHKDMVQHALAHRVEMIKTLSAALAAGNVGPKKAPDEAPPCDETCPL